MLSKASVIPLHIQLADVIRDQVKRKELLPNDRLPSERELCEKYSISRITVRKALSTLTQEGLVRSSAGKGSFITEPALNEELRPLSSFTEDLERRGLQSASRILEAALIPADDALSRRLKIPRGAEVVRLNRLRLADQLPIAIQLTHLPHHLCPNLLDYNFSDRSLYDVLRDVYNLRLARSETTILASLAQAQEAALLQLKRPAAVLISEQITFTDSAEIIEMTRSVFHAERYSLRTQA